MDKTYTPQSVESDVYRMWEDGGYFSPDSTSSKTSFAVIMPPPNANAPLHMGHALYVIEDIMIRYHRMKGDKTLWLPGADHAGFETQFVFEKFLAKQGKSRFDYDSETLYHMIWDFVDTNRGTMETQLKRLGFSADWKRLLFTLDPIIVSTVCKTFKQLYEDGLIYRDTRLVNYCTKCGTGFSDLEVKHVQQTDPLYYMRYGPLTLATVRPETKFGDTAVAVHPDDKRYTDLIGKTITFDGLIGSITLTVIADEAVDPEFGTGVVKVTPAHDPTDYEIGKRHHLPMKQVIGFDGKLTALAGRYAGLRIKAARKQVVEDMQAKGLIEKIDTNYTHMVSTCYKCGTILEPLPMQQWFISVKPLAQAANRAIEEKKVRFIPKRFEKLAIRWLDDFHDWNISRQIVWGIRIPAWQCTHCASQSNNDHFNLGWIVTDGNPPSACPSCGNTDLKQETDTFDTWFSSGQWPFATLQTIDQKHNTNDFQQFYPTAVMETGYDILPWWVCRMLMLGIYRTGDIPFHTVYLHGLVRDAKGQKMSKSKGNVMDPLDMVNRYGADALRIALIFGTAAGNDQSLSEDKIRGMRNFINKLWNISRFVLSNLESSTINYQLSNEIFHSNNKEDKQIIKDLHQLIKKTTKDLEQYRFSDVIQDLYEFTWHRLADQYIESSKDRIQKGDTQAIQTLLYIVPTLLKLLHPFIPFITEKLWNMLPKKTNDPLIISSWPTL